MNIDAATAIFHHNLSRLATDSVERRRRRPLRPAPAPSWPRGVS